MAGAGGAGTVSGLAHEPFAPNKGRTVRIGITGPIGCGKSQVVRWLAELGVAIVDADAVARTVTAPGNPVHDAVVRHFGPAIAGPDGMLDRAALGRLVFAEPSKLRELEAIVHPAVRPRILDVLERAERDGAPAVAVEAIKLVEGGLAAMCDEVWLVICDGGAQRQRLLERGTVPADADQRIAVQEGLADRLRPAATRILDTSGSMAATRAMVVAALAEALAAAR
jgi:dephospho-CoA kinase